ncbi:outer membrane protein assembly factor BamB family protein [Natrarchaeobius halalkaliphilus]|nr:PQQ-binding-like beta-propeller repeat protein [Natrarchaeobius halalkaliphilus]
MQPLLEQSEEQEEESTTTEGDADSGQANTDTDSGNGATDHENARLYSVDSSTGEINWTHDTVPNGQETRITAVTSAEGMVFYATTDSGGGDEQDPVVRCLDADTGDELWEHTFDEGFFAGLSLSGDELYVAKWHDVIVLDVDSGDRLTQYGYSPSYAGFVEGDSHLYFLGSDAVAFDPVGGSERWSRELERTPESRPIFEDDVLYYGTETGHVVALDATDGSQSWETRVDGNASRRPTLTEDHVWVLDEQGVVSAIDRTEGDLVYEHDDRIDGHHIESIDTLVYIPESESANQGTVYEETVTGGELELSERWTYPSSDLFVITRDGEFIGGWNGVNRVSTTGEISMEAEFEDEYSPSFDHVEDSLESTSDTIFVGTSQ